MKHGLYINRTIFVASLMFFLLILPGMSPAAELEEKARASSEVQGQDLEQIAVDRARASSEQGQGLEQIAVESAQDTLKACLGRIPLDASAGQLMLAEQSCRQIEVERNEIRLSF